MLRWKKVPGRTGGKDLVTRQVNTLVPCFESPGREGAYWEVYRASNESYPSNCCSLSQTPPKIHTAMTIVHTHTDTHRHNSNLFMPPCCTSHLQWCFLGKHITSVTNVSTSVKLLQTQTVSGRCSQHGWSTDADWQDALLVSPCADCHQVAE